MENNLTMRCIAVDDEPLALQQIVKYINDIPFFTLVGQADSASAANELIQKNEVDVVFLDISMPDVNGIEFAKQLTENPPMIVFTTAHNQYAIEGYKVNAVDYLLKPFSFEEFKETANRLQRRFQLMQSADVSFVDDDRAIFLKTDRRIVRLEIDDIVYVEGMSEYLKIHVKNEKPIVVLLSMKRMEEQLQRYAFMRVHRSYIINLKEISEVSKGVVVLNDGTELPIGNNCRDAFMNYIYEKFIGKDK